MKTLTPDNALSIINKISAFEALNRDEKYFLSNFKWGFKVYEQGQYLTREGDKDDRFFILLTGMVSISKGYPEKVLTQLEPGEIFGEIGFLSKEERTASVSAVKTSSVLEMDRLFMQKLPIEIREKLKDKIIENLISRLKMMNTRFSLGQL